MPHQDPFTDASEAPKPPLPAVRPSRLRAGWERALRVLARAEKRIMENFRVPPHGG